MDLLGTARVGCLKLPLFGWSTPPEDVNLDLRDYTLGDTRSLRDDNLACSWYGTFVVQTDNIDKLCNNLKGQATIVDDLGCTTSVDGKQLLNVVLSVNAPYKDKRWLVRPVHLNENGVRSRDEWRVFDQTLVDTKFKIEMVSEVSRVLDLWAEKQTALRAVRDRMGGRAGLIINTVSQAIDIQDDMYLAVSLDPLETLLVPQHVRQALLQQNAKYADELAHATAELRDAEQTLATVWNSQGRAFLEAEIGVQARAQFANVCYLSDMPACSSSVHSNLEAVFDLLKRQQLVTDTDIDAAFAAALSPTVQFELATTAMNAVLQQASVDQDTPAAAVEKLLDLKRLLEGYMSV